MTIAAGRPASLPSASPLRSLTGRGQTSPFAGEMLHQPEKEGQIGLAHTLFVERQDEEAGARMDEVVRVLDAFGDAFCRQELADAEAGDESGELLVRDLGVDGHW